MSSTLLRVAVGVARFWTRLYTLGMRADIRNARLTEIESDLWECQHDPVRPANAPEILARFLLGAPHDLLWRIEQAADANTHSVVASTRRSVTVSAFTCSLTVHLVALAGTAWWASWPAANTPSRVRTSRAQAIEGPGLIASATLAVSESARPAQLDPSEKEPGVTKAALLVGAMLTATPLPVAAQTAAADPAFEAATVRPNKSGHAGWRLEPQPGGRLTGTNVPAAALIRFAYDLPDFQIVGGPGWLDAERFDIAAKAEGDPPLNQKRSMLRRLLTERFKLRAHTETRELPIYALVMARSDAKPGAQLRRSEAGCDRAESLFDQGVGPVPRDGPPRCGYFGFAPGTDLPKGRGGLAFRGLTLGMFAKRLVPIVRRTVSDETGMAGYFDADFDFVAELPPPPPPPGMPSSFGSEPLVSVFTVLPEQLGLKLDSRRGPVEVLVIDRIEPATPD